MTKVVVQGSGRVLQAQDGFSASDAGRKLRVLQFFELGGDFESLLEVDILGPGRWADGRPLRGFLHQCEPTFTCLQTHFSRSPFSGFGSL